MMFPSPRTTPPIRRRTKWALPFSSCFAALFVFDSREKGRRTPSLRVPPISKEIWTEIHYHDPASGQRRPRSFPSPRVRLAVEPFEPPLFSIFDNVAQKSSTLDSRYRSGHYYARGISASRQDRREGYLEQLFGRTINSSLSYERAGLVLTPHSLQKFVMRLSKLLDDDGIPLSDLRSTLLPMFLLDLLPWKVMSARKRIRFMKKSPNSPSQVTQRASALSTEL